MGLKYRHKSERQSIIRDGLPSLLVALIEVVTSCDWSNSTRDARQPSLPSFQEIFLPGYITGFAIPPSLATLTYPLQLRRSWKETKIILANPLPEPDPPLVKALYKAHLWIADLKAGASVAEVAAKHALTGSDLRKRIYLACLSPKIQRAILAGTFPDTISLTSLATQKLPLSWAEQHALFLNDTPC